MTKVHALLKNRLFAAIVLLILVIVSASVAIERTGTVRQIRRGSLQRWIRQTWEPLSVGSAVGYGERLRTSADGVAVITMPGQGDIVIGPSTEMTLAKDEPRAVMKMDRGAMWMHARPAPGSTMTVQSPNLVAGVRGTKFSVLSDSEGAALCTCRGLVDVTLPDSSVLPSATAQFVPFDYSGPAPRHAVSDRALLRRVTGGRYDWCFNCHEVGGRGRLKRDWVME